MADFRPPVPSVPFRDRGGERPTFTGQRPGPPAFNRPRTPDLATPPHSVRIRDGDQEIDVTGSPPFVRQILDDLPSLLAKLRGEPGTRPSANRLPAPASASAPTPPPVAAASKAVEVDIDDDVQLEKEILSVLRKSTKAIAASAIREQLDTQVTGQRVRRLLEGHDGVVVSDDRPARYRLRRR